MAILKIRQGIKALSNIGLIALLLLPMQANGVLIEQVKTVFIVNIAKYTSWPDSDFSDKDSLFRICVIAEPAMFKLIKITTQGQTVNGRLIEAIDLSQAEPPVRCHIKFISHAKYQPSLLKQTTSILLISDFENFARQPGAMIELKEQDKRLKIVANYDNVLKAGLSIRAALLSLVEIVK